VLPFLLLQAVVGFTVLEAVNYLEHYGLLRQRNAAGRYEKVDPRHSWNSDRLTTNVFLFQPRRHSDHHANPLPRYQTLRSFDVSPQLPAGYASAGRRSTTSSTGGPASPRPWRYARSSSSRRPYVPSRGIPALTSVPPDVPPSRTP
jgi:hypothetical protein